MAGGECRLISGNVQPEPCLRASVQLLIDGVQLYFVTAGSREGITAVRLPCRDQLKRAAALSATYYTTAVYSSLYSMKF